MFRPAFQILLPVAVAFVPLAGAGLLAQTPNPTFDVASVMPNGSGQLAMRISAPPGTGRFEATKFMHW